MATVALNKDNFEHTVGANEVVLVDFWASWCGPCRMFAPIFEAASEAHRDVVFAKVDTEAEQELAARFGIKSVPTLLAFRDNVVRYAHPGALPAPALEQLIAKVQELDMDEVRRQIEEQPVSPHEDLGSGTDVVQQDVVTNALEIVLDQPLADVEAALRQALSAEGFGILTEIDVAATLEAKLGVHRPPMKILGACNPSLAHRALGIDPSLALLLPCNVVIEDAAGGGTHVAIADPRALLGAGGAGVDDRLSALGTEAASALERALARLRR